MRTLFKLVVVSVMRTHPCQHPVHDEGLDGCDVTLRVVDSDEEVSGVDPSPDLLLLQAKPVDHGP